MSDLIVKMVTPVVSAETKLDTLPFFNNDDYSLKPFDERVIDFFDAYSKRIFSNKEIQRMPEIAALAFWLRKSNLLQLKKENERLFDTSFFHLSPLGRVFHICPANVDTMFIYSLAVSVLMGNKNLLRLSSRMDAPHVTALFTLLNESIEANQLFASYINIISYDHSDDVSNYISARSSARVIWGGDKTIGTFKKFTVSPRTKDIVFADRVSMLCINCKTYLGLSEEENKAFCHNFFNDGYTFDQMGCSSPQTIYFLGNDDDYKSCVKKMQESLPVYLREKYATDMFSLASLKLNRIADDSIDGTIVKATGDNYITLVQLDNEVDESGLHGCGGGYFYSKRITHINELSRLKKAKVQTVSYFGLSEKEKQSLLGLANGEGIDRIVPLGTALNFHYIWDGYNLFDELSKKIFYKQV